MLRQFRTLFIVFFMASGLVAKGHEPLVVIEDADHISFLEKGRMDQNSVRQVLSSLTTKTELAFLKRMLEDEQCIKIKSLGQECKGAHTGELFAITVKESCVTKDNVTNADRYRPLYILKESTKGIREIRNLQKVRISPLGNLYLGTEQRIQEQIDDQGYEMALITFEDLHFKIKLHGHKDRYFSLLQTAPGKSLQKHLQDFGSTLLHHDASSLEYTYQIQRMKHIFYRVGFSISKLHQHFAKNSGVLGKGYRHGDIHAQNLFYDDETDDVSLIDNETFAMGLKRSSSGINDIVDLYLLHSVRTIAHYFSNLMTNEDLNIDDDLWHDLWHDLFLGYLQAHEPLSQAEKIIAFNEFRSKFLASLSTWQLFDNVRNIKDQRALKRMGPSIRRFWLKEKRVQMTLKEVRESWLK